MDDLAKRLLSSDVEVGGKMASVRLFLFFPAGISIKYLYLLPPSPKKVIR